MCMCVHTHVCVFACVLGGGGGGGELTSSISPTLGMFRPLGLISSVLSVSHWRVYHCGTIDNALWVHAEQNHCTGLCSNHDNQQPLNYSSALVYMYCVCGYFLFTEYL